VIDRIRADVWRFVTAAAQREDDVLLEAGALLQMRPGEVRTLGRIHFLLSEEVGRMLARMPRLVRRLTTTTTPEEEASAERVRGPVRWGETLARRAATGLPHLYVTAPARRAFQTPENEVLVHALAAIGEVGRATGWHESSVAEAGATIRERVEQSDHWLQTRMLSGVEHRPPGPQVQARVRTGRAARRYQAALDVTRAHAELVGRADRKAVQHAIRNVALVTRRDEVLLELLTAFQLERSLRDLGWQISMPGLVGGGLLLKGTSRGRRLEVFYQHTPAELSQDSRYRLIQQAHPFERVGGMVPDFVFRIRDRSSDVRWVLVEVKGGDSAVHQLARRAIRDLLAYRRAFDTVLGGGAAPYGLGVAWGSELEPSRSAEIVVSTPDKITESLQLVLGEN
jgi:hypothetical protein